MDDDDDDLGDLKSEYLSEAKLKRKSLVGDEEGEEELDDDDDDVDVDVDDDDLANG